MNSLRQKVKVFDDLRNRKRDITCPFKFAKYIHEEIGAKAPQGGTGALWFRGQANSKWGLIPTIGRERDFYNTDSDIRNGSELDLIDSERALLSRFRRDAYPYVKRVLSEWEAITLAQHHGLPTRLLDWSSNPLVSLYFAVESHKDEDGAIYGYRPRDTWEHQISMFERQNHECPDVPDPMMVKGIKIVFPILLASRLIAQSGGFTIQNPYADLFEQCKNEEFDDESLDIFEIYRWCIPKGKKEEIAKALHRCSINHKTLFPDLDGLGEGMIRGESFRKGGGWIRKSTRKPK